jgi:AcrR family transcriptional regulator
LHVTSSSPVPANGPTRYTDAAKALLRERIIAAVDQFVRTQGWSATTMTQIAEGAGISRQTVYHEFGSRQELLQSYLAGEIDSILRQVELAVQQHADSPRDALRDAFSLFLRLASEEPAIQLVVADSDAPELNQMLTVLGRIIGTERIGVLITRTWPGTEPAEAALLAESIVRLAISHALLPGPGPADVPDQVTQLLGPFMDLVIPALIPGSGSARADANSAVNGN